MLGSEVQCASCSGIIGGRFILVPWTHVENPVMTALVPPPCPPPPLPAPLGPRTLDEGLEILDSVLSYEPPCQYRTINIHTCGFAIEL